jgi:hypothetical protein
MLLRAVTILLAAAILHARPIEQRLRWDQLPAADMTGRKLRVTTSTGRETSGRLLRIDADALVFAKATIPRSSVSRIRYAVTRRTRWQAIGAAIGAGATVPVVALAASWRRNEGGIYANRNLGIAIGLMGGATAAGYFAGRSADTDTITIFVEPG